MSYDVIVIGGGPSGLMAAIAAGEKGANVLLIEKGDKLGKKLAISGGGRCNVTNRLPLDEIVKHIPGNGRFLYSAFSIFNNEDIIKFFEGLGVKLKEEDHGRMFPVSNDAQSVVQALIQQMKKLKIKVMLHTSVKEVNYENEQVSGVTLHNREFLKSKSVIIAVGGKSVPHTGSTGDGYAWAKAAGHTITELFPTEVPLTSNEPFIKAKELQGLSLRNVAVSVLNPKGKKIVTHQMDMIFTHFGLSGPAILRCSQFVVKALKKFKTDKIQVQIDLFPALHKDQLIQELNKRLTEGAKKSIKNVLREMIPERYLLFLLKKNDIDPQMQCTNISKKSMQQLAEDLKEFSVNVNGTLPMEKAFITGGGVSTKEIAPKTMESKLVNHLFFCGEILDIHGYTGGYNITAAMVTGRLAGMNAGISSQ